MRLLINSARASLALVGEDRPWKWIGLVGLAVAVAILEVVGAAMIYTLISVVAGGGSQVVLPIVGDLDTSFLGMTTRSLQIATACIVALFFLLRGGAIIGQQYIQARVVENAGARVANRLVRGYLSMPYLFHTQHNSAELVRNAFDSAQRLVLHILTPLVHILSESVLVFGLMFILLIVSPMATVLTILGLVPTIWLLLRFIQPRLKRFGRRSQAARIGSLQSLQQALGGFRDIQLLGRQQHFAQSFEHERNELARSEYLRSSIAVFPRVLIETALVLIIVAIFMVSLVASETIESLASTLGVFAYVGLRLQPSLRTLVSGFNNLRFGSAILEDLGRDHERIREAQEAESRRGVAGRSDFRREIELRDVSFVYAPDAAWAVQSVNLVIRRGEFVGICGPTGGGKSTLVDLIVGLLRPTRGQVWVDGVDLSGREPQWQAQIGVVSQNVFLIDDTIRANVAFGRASVEVDEHALMRAISRAQLAEVVASLPAGLDTRVGERGIRLSGGQRQRIGIARALYREPAVLILDEGTSALDSATEAALADALDELRSRRTVVSVAHRISTVRQADRIVVVDGGRIVGEGRYDELIEGHRLFQSLAR